MKILRLKNLQDAELGNHALQWLYNLDVKPTISGIQNIAPLLALGYPKVKNVKRRCRRHALAAFREKYFLSGARGDGEKITAGLRHHE